MEQREARISVEVPSALLGFMLVLRLQNLDADVVPDGDGGWAVVLPADAPRGWVLSSVQAWLDDETLAETTVHFGDELVVLGTRATVAGGVVSR